MQKVTTRVLLLLMSITMLLVGCHKPTPKPQPQNSTKGDILVYTMMPNPDGRTGAGWMQLVDGMTPQTLSLENATQVEYGMMPVCNGNDIYTFPAAGSQGDANVITKWLRKDGQISKVKTMPVPVNSIPRNIIFINPTKAYLITLIGKFIIFNPEKMETIGEIDFAPYAAPGLNFPMFGAPLYLDGYVYFTLNQYDMTFAPKTGPQVELAVVNTTTDKVERIIKEEKSGIAMGSYNYGNQIFCDEKGDLYILCTGGFGMIPGYQTGILRLKKGDKEFDSSYSWVLNDQLIEGDGGKPSMIMYGQYSKGGKLYATADVPIHWSDPKAPNWLKDKSIVSMEIDLYNKRIKKLPIPLSSAYAGGVEKYKDLIVFAIQGKEDVGFYTHNPATGETSKEAVLKVNGIPVTFHCFDK